MEKTKTIAIHQPNFLPWLGYFYKIAQSDVFVLLDDVEYTKNSFINRNRIKTSTGVQWLTVPVSYSEKSKQLICESTISQPDLHLKKLIKKLRSNYGKAPFFKQYFPEIENILSNQHLSLSLLNEQVIHSILTHLQIDTPFVKASSLAISATNATDRLIEICNILEGTNYLAGFGGKKYQASERMIDAGLTVKTTDFVHPVYSQLWEDFIPNLSIIDYILNCGPEASLFFKK